MKVYFENLIAGLPMKLYSLKPPPPVSGLGKEQQAAHEALHDSRRLLAVLERTPEGGYAGTVIESGVVTHFEIEGVLEGTVGVSGADLNFSSTNLLKDSTLTAQITFS